MKTRDMAKKGLYVGTGAGLVLFVLAGLLPGSLIGGVIGLKVITAVTGAPLGGAILSRILLAVSMLMGIMASAAACIMGPGLIGWSIGYLIDSVKVEVATEQEAAKKA
ncbi:MAG: hypothetical protein AB1306_00270 [Nitrospirota bacterium]